MTPLRIMGETHRLGAPKGWENDAAGGKCVSLSIRFKAGVCASAWEPTPAELECLNTGGRVILEVFGNGQPPVMLSVEPAP